MHLRFPNWRLLPTFIKFETLSRHQEWVLKFPTFCHFQDQVGNLGYSFTWWGNKEIWHETVEEEEGEEEEEYKAKIKQCMAMHHNRNATSKSTVLPKLNLIHEARRLREEFCKNQAVGPQFEKKFFEFFVLSEAATHQTNFFNILMIFLATVTVWQPLPGNRGQAKKQIPILWKNHNFGAYIWLEIFYIIT